MKNKKKYAQVFVPNEGVIPSYKKGIFLYTSDVEGLPFTVKNALQAYPDVVIGPQLTALLFRSISRNLPINSKEVGISSKELDSDFPLIAIDPIDQRVAFVGPFDREWDWMTRDVFVAMKGEEIDWVWSNL